MKKNWIALIMCMLLMVSTASAEFITPFTEPYVGTWTIVCGLDEMHNRADLKDPELAQTILELKEDGTAVLTVKGTTYENLTWNYSMGYVDLQINDSLSYHMNWQNGDPATGAFIMKDSFENQVYEDVIFERVSVTEAAGE